MTGCSAINCSNHSKNGFKFHRFPADPERRKKWVINCRRKEWNPTQQDRLCSIHFEESQYEESRMDDKRRLRPFAVPTLFDVPNPPKLIMKNEIESVYKRIIDPPNHIPAQEVLVPISNDSCFELNLLPNQEQQNELDNLKNEVKNLKAEINGLRNEVINLKNENEKINVLLFKFLSKEQLSKLSSENRKWGTGGILKGLKFRFALGKNGYNYLRETGYPLPSYSTLNKRIFGIKVDFGIFNSIFDTLKIKVSCMMDIEKDCALMVDEMEISGDLDFDKSQKIFVGKVTLGNRTAIGNHLTVVALRGINTPWKQIVACHVTGPSTTGNEMKNLILKVITESHNIGLKVRTLVSDMGSNNKALWASLGVAVTRQERQCNFKVGDDTINVFADGPHLLKNWKSAVLSSHLVLPNFVQIQENLPTNIVSGKHIVKLWEEDLKNAKGLRLLHHLTPQIINPNQFSKMHVGNAMRFFSIRTAGALETAVARKILPPAALATAWFIRLLSQWFELINSRRRCQSITSRNATKKEEFLKYFITVIEGTVIIKGWKPLNTGSILTSLSYLNTAKSCFNNGYQFLLGSRLNQDAIENIFSSVRRRSAKRPSAMSAKRAIKLICLTQFISKIKYTNYSTDSDHYLLDYAEMCRSNETNDNKTNAGLNVAAKIDFTPVEKLNIHYMAGSCINHLLHLKIGLCDECKQFVQGQKNDAPVKGVTLTECCDLGGLKYVSQNVYVLLESTERLIQQNKSGLLENTATFTDIQKTIEEKYKENFPKCCNILGKLTKHYVTVRGFSIKSHESAKRKSSTVFSSQSMNKKTKK